MDVKTRYRKWESEFAVPLFFQSWWLDVVAPDWGIIMSEEMGTVRGFWPLPKRTIGGLTLLQQPLLTPYLGPFIVNKSFAHHYELIDYEEKVLKDLLLQLPRYDALAFNTMPNNFHFLPFRHRGFKQTPKLTYYINLLQDIEAIKSQMPTRMQRYINAAPKHFSIIECSSIPEAFYEMHKKTFEKQKAHYPYSRQLLEAIMVKSQSKGQGCLLAAQKENEFLGFLWVAHDDAHMYQLLSCYADGKGKNGVMPALTFAAIVKAKELNLKVYDTEGSVHPGIEPFHRKLGGERQLYLSYSHTPSWLWKLKQYLRS